MLICSVVIKNEKNWLTKPAKHPPIPTSRLPANIINPTSILTWVGHPSLVSPIPVPVAHIPSDIANRFLPHLTIIAELPLASY